MMHMLFTLKIGIITWLCNTSIPTIHMEFGGCNTTNEVWYILDSQYSRSNGARDHNLMVALYQLQHEPSKCITAFHSHLHFL